MIKKIPPFPRLAGRLYFFPALLSLVDIVPWLLTVLGGVVGVAGLADMALWKTHRKKIIVTVLACFIAAAVVIRMKMPDKVVIEQGTQAIPANKLPTPKPAPVTIVAYAAPDKKPAFGEIWTRTTEKQILSTPVIAKNMLIYGSLEGSVEAVSLQDGHGLWSLSQHAPVYAVGQGAGDIIYSGEGLHETTSARLTALRASNGTPLWQREFLGHIENPPAIDDMHHSLWLGTGPGGFWALNTKDGAVLWHQPLGTIDSTPLAFNNLVYVSAQPDEKIMESALYALGAGDGHIIWHTPLPGQPWGSPDTDSERKTIWITSGLGQINVTRPTDSGWATAVSTADGKVLWQKKLPGMAVQPDLFLPAEGLIIYAITTGELVALHIRDGTVAWNIKISNGIQSPAVLLEGAGTPLIAITTFDGIFSVRRADTGEEVMRRAVPPQTTSSPVSSGDNVYVATEHSITAFSGVHTLRGVH